MRKSILSAALLLAATTAQAGVEINNPGESLVKEVRAEVIAELSGDNTERNIDVKNIKRLNESDNYYIKVVESGQEYTMLYIRELKSIIIPQSGDLYNIESGKYINKDYDAAFVKPLLTSEINKEDLMVFPSKQKDSTDSVIVFTDPSCPYCTKLHAEIGDYQDLGITVNYLPFPRGGVNGPGYDALVDSYCSTDPISAFSAIKNNGGVVPDELKKENTPAEIQECKDLVQKYYDLGNRLGVTGTPAIFDNSGYQIGGYIPAARAKQQIQMNKY
tara:strand:- start:22597 stop:23418 length:822 start_codon:yes stop_codon:yes gene_type:complete